MKGVLGFLLLGVASAQSIPKWSALSESDSKKEASSDSASENRSPLAKEASSDSASENRSPLAKEASSDSASESGRSSKSRSFFTRQISKIMNGMTTKIVKPTLENRVFLESRHTSKPSTTAGTRGIRLIVQKAIEECKDGTRECLLETVRTLSDTKMWARPWTDIQCRLRASIPVIVESGQSEGAPKEERRVFLQCGIDKSDRQRYDEDIEWNYSSDIPAGMCGKLVDHYKGDSREKMVKLMGFLADRWRDEGTFVRKLPLLKEYDYGNAGWWEAAQKSLALLSGRVMPSSAKKLQSLKSFPERVLESIKSDLSIGEEDLKTLKNALGDDKFDMEIFEVGRPGMKDTDSAQLPERRAVISRIEFSKNGRIVYVLYHVGERLPENRCRKQSALHLPRRTVKRSTSRQK